MNITLDIQIIASFLQTAKKEIEKGNRTFIDYRYVNSNGKYVSAK